ncbi:DNA-binding transcriptional LysR family regulator [Agrobacterium vitis]|nr:DNA-binding transcriptional LysR family regulator [Agrobacterium vitis]MBE1440238.1 DNA-binding transcriptional LysR family regulator [Agrobacterium vitis]
MSVSPSFDHRFERPKPCPVSSAESRQSLSASPASLAQAFNHSDAICDAVLADRGIALLSTWLIADHLREGRLIQMLPNIETRGFPIHALWPHVRHLAPKVRVVVDELASRFLPEPPWNGVE